YTWRYCDRYLDDLYRVVERAVMEPNHHARDADGVRNIERELYVDVFNSQPDSTPTFALSSQYLTFNIETNVTTSTPAYLGLPPKKARAKRYRQVSFPLIVLYYTFSVMASSSAGNTSASRGRGLSRAAASQRAVNSPNCRGRSASRIPADMLSDMDNMNQSTIPEEAWTNPINIETVVIQPDGQSRKGTPLVIAPEHLGGKTRDIIRGSWKSITPLCALDLIQHGTETIINPTSTKLNAVVAHIGGTVNRNPYYKGTVTPATSPQKPSQPRAGATTRAAMEPPSFNIPRPSVESTTPHAPHSDRLAALKSSHLHMSTSIHVSNDKDDTMEDLVDLSSTVTPAHQSQLVLRERSGTRQQHQQPSVDPLKRPRAGAGQSREPLRITQNDELTGDNDYNTPSTLEMIIPEVAYQYGPNTISRAQYLDRIEERVEYEIRMYEERRNRIEDETRRSLQSPEVYQARLMFFGNAVAHSKYINCEDVQRLGSLSPEDEIIAARDYRMAADYLLYHEWSRQHEQQEQQQQRHQEEVELRREQQEQQQQRQHDHEQSNRLEEQLRLQNQLHDEQMAREREQRTKLQEDFERLSRTIEEMNKKRTAGEAFDQNATMKRPRQQSTNAPVYPAPALVPAISTTQPPSHFEIIDTAHGGSQGLGLESLLSMAADQAQELLQLGMITLSQDTLASMDMSMSNDDGAEGENREEYSGGSEEGQIRE
ncbi:hypothetical protein KEM56_005049, partial [Ascosphaera pollenicola]